MKKNASLLLLFLFPAQLVLASGAGSSSGETLIEPAGARAASLGEAFSAVEDDISAFGYNPASLPSLSSKQASFLYQKGLADDAYGNFLFGAPLQKGALGFSFGYYDGGNFNFFDGVSEKTIRAKTDLTAALGYGWAWNRMRFGFSGKYISSELVEKSKATAFAGDVGFQYGVLKNLTMGGAVQNIGGKMTYVSESQSLPSVMRLGAAWGLPTALARFNLLAEAPYYINDAQVRPALGVEGLVGPLALRAGYKSQGDLTGFSFGAGFILGNATLDYSYGLVQDLKAEHRMSFSLKFGDAKNSNLQTLSQHPSENASAIKFVNRISSEEKYK